MNDRKKYQIFISIAHDNLTETKNKVVKSIFNLSHLPIMMETFNSDNEEEWEVIKNAVNTSDYYILIIGNHQNPETKKRINHIEKEYKYAKEQDIPILTFIKGKEASADKTDERCECWKTPEDLAQKISTSLLKIFNEHPQPGWIRTDKAVPSKASKEIIKLNQEKRKLKQKLNNLESKNLTEPKVNKEFKETNNEFSSNKELTEDRRSNDLYWRIKNTYDTFLQWFKRE